LPELIACDMARMGCWQWHAIDVGDGRVASIYELLDRAVAAINRGDRVAASALADQVLAVDEGNVEAEDLLTAPGDAGENRRLTILFADLVDSTVLSTRVEPETYRMLVGATAIRCKEIGLLSGHGQAPLYRSSSGVGSLRPVLTRY